MTFNDYRLYQVTIGCDKSSIEVNFKVIALDPEKAIEMAINLAKKDKWPKFSSFAATNIRLIDNRVKN